MTDDPDTDTSDQRVRVLAITRKPHSASFEQRILNYIEPLRDLGIDVGIRTYPKQLVAQHRLFKQAADWDVVWWHRHLLPWWQLRWLRRHAKYLVYDFDDPLCFSTRTDGISRVRQARFARQLRKVDVAMVGSHYLRDLASPYCDNVQIIPMAIDLPDVGVTAGERRSSELLWLGSESTQKYLETIRPALEALGEKYPDVRLRLVAHKPMAFGALKTDFVQWTRETQEAALRECSVGLCPMPDTPWSRGKCPYKVLQYMAYGMSWIGSAVGENVVTAGTGDGEGRRGLTAESVSEWVNAVDYLLADAAKREAMGGLARTYVEETHERRHVAARIATILARKQQLTPSR